MPRLAGRIRLAALVVGCVLLLPAARARAAAHAPSTLPERLAGLRIAAHRGGMRFDDANTIARFEEARLQGADIVETDLRASRDGVPFLFHDPKLDHATDCHGPLHSLSARAIRRCRLTGVDHGPETFEDALRWSAGRVVINGDLKDLKVIRPAIDLVRKYDAYEWVYFQVGPGSHAYRKARAYDGRVALSVAPRGPGAEASLTQLLSLHDDRLLVIELHPEILSADNLERIRSANKLASINAWYVGDERTRLDVWPLRRKAACDAAYKMGVTIAVTNVPEDCVQQRIALLREGARPRGGESADGTPGAAP